MNPTKNGRDLKTAWDAFISDANEQAFYCLYGHYYDYFSFLGGKRNQRADRVADSINDLFLYVYENRSRLLNVRDHHNYLVTAFIRKLFRKVPVERELSGWLSEEHVYPSPEVQLIQQSMDDELKCALKKLIGQLPAKQHRMIYQKFYLGMSYREISLSNRVSEKTAYNTIYIAVDKLRNLLGKTVHYILSFIALYLPLYMLMLIAEGVSAVASQFENQ
ncbi:RNA polymerase sigma factor [Parapedobacter lycopersici]|uniref:RNA polymerase sigma factor n=1 Tax=Parapedobacter lycopersici TaxID=1864939 RepID=UPI00214D9F01|nr:sigma-70 family RNA polymerase sigma factor [Parapedobacter lycopersici]